MTNLVNSPFINYFIYKEGSLAGKPLMAGTIDFFDDVNRTTRVNVYEQREGLPAQAYPNPIVLGAVGETPPIYLQDKLYYIVIKSKEGSVVETIEHYSPNGGQPPTTNEVSNKNLLPSFGFEFPVYQEYYNNVHLPIPTGKIPLFNGWTLLNTSTVALNKNFYKTEVLNNSGFLGNPLNKLIFTATDNPSGETEKKLFCSIGSFSSFQSITLTLSIRFQVTDGAIASLPVQLIREKQGVFQTPITVGSLASSASTLSTPISLTFAVPNIIDTGYRDGDRLLLALSFPLNQNFTFEATSSWCQIGSIISINEESLGVNTVDAIFNSSEIRSTDKFLNDFGGLGLSNGLSGIRSIKTTGTIVIHSSNNSIRNYHKIDDPKTLIKDELSGDTINNRLISYLRSSGGNYLLSPNTFVVKDGATTNEKEITLSIGSKEKDDLQWTNGSAGASVTVTRTKEAIFSKYKSIRNFDTYDLTIHLIATENGICDSAIFDPGGFFYTGGEFQDGGLHPTIANYIGIISASRDKAEPGEFEQKGVFAHEWEIIGQTPGTASSKGTYNFTLDSRLVSYNTVNRVAKFPIHQQAGVGADFRISGRKVTWGKSLEVTIERNPEIGIFTGFLGMMNPGNTKTTTNQTYNNTISFKRGNDPIVTPATTAGGEAVVIQLGEDDDLYSISRKLHFTFNSSFLYKISIVSKPTNGAYLLISTKDILIEFIFHEIDLFPIKPVKVTGRKAIYAEYNSTDAIDVIANKMKTALENGIMGIPTRYEMGLPSLPTGLSYWIHN